MIIDNKTPTEFFFTKEDIEIAMVEYVRKRRQKKDGIKFKAHIYTEMGSFGPIYIGGRVLVGDIEYRHCSDE